MRRPPKTTMLARAAALGLLAAGALLLGAAPAAADVNDFSYDRWHVAYELGVDAEGRAVAHVTETLAPRFPEVDQNRGIVRGLPIDYEGASTDPRDFSVTDAQGAAVPFEVEDEGGFRIVLVGDDRFVHGAQTYVIRYTLSDVVLARDDGAADEFYWDLADHEHAQPIAEFSAEIAVSPELAAELNGDARCYAGAAGSKRECAVEGPAEGGGEAFRIAPMPLGPYEGVTVAIGLQPGAVAQPPARLPSFALDVLPLGVAGAAVATAAGSSVAVVVMRRRRRVGRGTIVAQYEVPDHLPPLVAGPVAGATASLLPAQFVHLAVRGAMRIEEGEERDGFLGRGAPRPAFRLLDGSRAGDLLDVLALSELFGAAAAPGTAFALPKKDEEFAKRMRTLTGKGTEQARARGYFEQVRSPLGRALGLVSLGLVAVLAVLVVLGFATRDTPTPAIGLVLGGFAFFIAIAGQAKHWVHTPLGAEAREHLEGVREFIRVAEADRIRVLQSYEGAERRPDGTVDVVHLYERLLPYAMLFGLEKQWGEVLAVAYEHAGAGPAWYPAATIHGFGHFDGALSQFTSSLTSSAGYSSSSSGGSSGGGFSGGGGGGGFSSGR